MPKPMVAKVVSAILLSAAMAQAGIVQAKHLRERVVSSPLSVSAVSSTDLDSAVSVLDLEDLNKRGVTGLSDLRSGLIAPLRVQSSPFNSSTLFLSIRGIGAINSDQPARDSNVGVFLDGVYLGRSQGLGFDVLDLERIEVLRGPQGVAYGRNNVGGTVNLVTRKPSEQFEISQQVTVGGEYDEQKFITHINSGDFGGLRGKLSYLSNKHDGWVENEPENDFLERNDYWSKDNEAYRIALSWVGLENLSVNFAYEDNSARSTQGFFQGEGEFQAQTGVSLYLPESSVDVESYTLSGVWSASDNLAVKSLLSFRELDEHNFFNFGSEATLSRGDLQEQEQSFFDISLVGTFEAVDFVLGWSYFEEDISLDQSRLGTNSLSGSGEPVNSTAVVAFPGTDPVNSFPVSEFSRTLAESELVSQSVYAEFTLHISSIFDLSAGVRSTEDDRDIVIPVANHAEVNKAIDTDENPQIDYFVALSVNPSETSNVYLRYGTGYRSDGGSLISESSELFDSEEASNVELGVKAHLWDTRLNLEANVFYTEIEDQQIDFASPDNAALVEVVNAEEDSTYSGFELNTEVQLTRGLVVALQYSYLDSDIEPLNSPFIERAVPPALAPQDTHRLAVGSEMGDLVSFNSTQAPRHSGVFSLDYTFPAFSFGTLNVRSDLISSSSYFYSATIDDQSSRDVINARATLSDIQLDDNSGQLKISLWGNNLNDEEYVVNALSVNDTGGNPQLLRAFGEPRTYGVDVLYEFK